MKYTMKNTIMTLCGLLAAATSLSAQIEIVSTVFGQEDLFSSTATDFTLDYELKGGGATNVLAVGFFWDRGNTTTPPITDLQTITFGGVPANEILNLGRVGVAYWFNPTGSNFVGTVTEGSSGREGWIIHELSNVATGIMPVTSRTGSVAGDLWVFTTEFANSRIVNWIAVNDSSGVIENQKPYDSLTLTKLAQVELESTSTPGNFIGLLASGTAAAATVGSYSIGWTGGNSDVGIALGFAPAGTIVTPVSPWADFTIQSGAKDTSELGETGIGWIVDTAYPWVYGNSFASSGAGMGWLYIHPDGASLTGMYAYQSGAAEWLWLNNDLDGWFYRYPTAAHPDNGWERLP